MAKWKAGKRGRPPKGSGYKPKSAAGKRYRQLKKEGKLGTSTKKKTSSKKSTSTSKNSRLIKITGGTLWLGK